MHKAAAVTAANVKKNNMNEAQVHKQTWEGSIETGARQKMRK